MAPCSLLALQVSEVVLHRRQVVPPLLDVVHRHLGHVLAPLPVLLKVLGKR